MSAQPTRSPAMSCPVHEPLVPQWSSSHPQTSIAPALPLYGGPPGPAQTLSSRSSSSTPRTRVFSPAEAFTAASRSSTAGASRHRPMALVALADPAAVAEPQEDAPGDDDHQ